MIILQSLKRPIVSRKVENLSEATAFNFSVFDKQGNWEYFFPKAQYTLKDKETFEADVKSAFKEFEWSRNYTVSHVNLTEDSDNYYVSLDFSYTPAPKLTRHERNIAAYASLSVGDVVVRNSSIFSRRFNPSDRVKLVYDKAMKGVVSFVNKVGSAVKYAVDWLDGSHSTEDEGDLVAASLLLKSNEEDNKLRQVIARGDKKELEEAVKKYGKNYMMDNGLTLDDFLSGRVSIGKKGKATSSLIIKSSEEKMEDKIFYSEVGGGLNYFRTLEDARKYLQRLGFKMVNEIRFEDGSREVYEKSYGGEGSPEWYKGEEKAYIRWKDIENSSVKIRSNVKFEGLFKELYSGFTNISPDTDYDSFIEMLYDAMNDPSFFQREFEGTLTAGAYNYIWDKGRKLRKVYSSKFLFQEQIQSMWKSRLRKK